jgi:hypothetical protein
MLIFSKKRKGEMNDNILIYLILPFLQLAELIFEKFMAKRMRPLYDYSCSQNKREVLGK